MSEVEEEDALEFVTRLSVKKLENGNQMSGSRTFAGVIIFVRMAFKTYQRKNRGWLNPFKNVDPPSYKSITRDAMPENEVLKLFYPGTLKRTMELAVCAAIFLSGLRRSEVAALKPEDLDWNTPKITVKRAWQDFDSRNRVLGPPKGKKIRKVPFDPILQEAIKNFGMKMENTNLFFVGRMARPLVRHGHILILRNGLYGLALSLMAEKLCPIVPDTPLLHCWKKKVYLSDISKNC
jgi:integrase